METLKQFTKHDLQRLSPSQFVRRFSEAIVLAAKGRPILDVGCGGCRNALLLASLGANVIGLDIDLQPAHKHFDRLTETVFKQSLNRINLLKRDLLHSPWTYSTESVGGIINVHFLHQPLIRSFIDSLGVGGLLLIETIGAHGGNHTELPPAGRLRELVGTNLLLVKYQERRAAPPGIDAVTVKLIAQKIQSTIG